MANPAMKDRHWDRIAKITQHTFDFDSDNFTLRGIMEAPLLPHKEDIEVSPSFLFTRSHFLNLISINGVRAIPVLSL